MKFKIVQLCFQLKNNWFSFVNIFPKTIILIFQLYITNRAHRIYQPICTLNNCVNLCHSFFFCYSTYYLVLFCSIVRMCTWVWLKHKDKSEIRTRHNPQLYICVSSTAQNNITELSPRSGSRKYLKSWFEGRVARLLFVRQRTSHTFYTHQSIIIANICGIMHTISIYEYMYVIQNNIYLRVGKYAHYVYIICIYWLYGVGIIFI